jgi:chromosome segregation ATPase
MDAISFVLGLKSNALRSSQLKELIYRSGQLEEFEASQNITEHMPSDCSVALQYQTNDGRDIEFSRA